MALAPPILLPMPPAVERLVQAFPPHWQTSFAFQEGNAGASEYILEADAQAHYMNAMHGTGHWRGPPARAGLLTDPDGRPVRWFARDEENRIIEGPEPVIDAPEAHT